MWGGHGGKSPSREGAVVSRGSQGVASGQRLGGGERDCLARSTGRRNQSKVDIHSFLIQELAC